MAQLKQCPNGHYYDPSMYPSCPYCSGASTGIDRSVGTVESYGIHTVTPDRDMGGNSLYGADNGGIGTVMPNGGSFIKSTPGSGGTVPPEDYQTHTGIVKPGKLRKNDKAGGKMEEASASKEEEIDLPERYVVGWLVAVEGPYIGKSFEIYAGNTYIGRNEGDVVLKKDEFISGSKNANTIYDDRENCFYIVAGQSRNLIRVNEKVLPTSSAIELKPYDLIEMGMSKFRFVPFCCDQFQW